MNKIKKILLYSITVVVIVFTIIWHFYIDSWEAALPDGGENVVRVDLFVLWPLVITLIALSLYQLFRKN